MPRFDLPLAELETYRPDVTEPADFDEFWARTLAEARTHDISVELTPEETPFTTLDVWDVTFRGFGGDPVKAWLTVPRGATTPLPGIVEFIGYGGGRGIPVERLRWPSAGYAHLLVDTRGQGSRWGTGGDTDDPHGSGPATPGYLTRGIRHPDDYYYRRVFTDAVRAVDAARAIEAIDSDRIVVAGGSQGGGIAIAAAALADGVLATLPDVPFLSHFERAVALTSADPYDEIVRYLAVHRGAETEVFRTLSYFDGVSFAKRITAPALFSVGLLDPICPPSTVFAAYNHLASTDKEIAVYPFNEHEGGESYQWLRQAAFVAARI